MDANVLATMRAIQITVKETRKRTGNSALGVTVEQGLFSIVETTYPNGKVSKVDVLRSDLSFSEAIAALEAMQ